MLNLLTAYQKKHLVEFLPYHECDTPSRQAPDLECLVKLQAQHTQLRHIIFLTGRQLISCLSVSMMCLQFHDVMLLSDNPAFMCLCTEKHDDSFSQFSGSGVIVAGMNDIMNNFQSLLSVPEEPTLPDPGTVITNANISHSEIMFLNFVVTHCPLSFIAQWSPMQSEMKRTCP